MSNTKLRLLAVKISRLTVRERVELWRLLREMDGFGDDGGVREPRKPTPPSPGDVIGVLPRHWEGDEA